MTMISGKAAALAAAVAATAAGAAGAGWTGTPGQTAAEPVRCEILAEPRAGGVRLWAVAEADRPLAGEYRFEIDKRDRAGTAVTRQSGPFSVDGHRRAVIGDADVSLAGGTARVRLELDWRHARTACEATFRGSTFERARTTGRPAATPVPKPGGASWL